MAFCFSVPQLCFVCNFEQVFPSAVSFSFFLVVVLFAAYTFGMYGVLILSCPAPMSGISLYFLAHGFIFHPFSYYFSGGVVQVLILFFLQQNRRKQETEAVWTGLGLLKRSFIMAK